MGLRPYTQYIEQELPTSGSGDPHYYTICQLGDPDSGKMAIEGVYDFVFRAKPNGCDPTTLGEFTIQSSVDGENWYTITDLTPAQISSVGRAIDQSGADLESDGYGSPITLRMFVKPGYLRFLGHIDDEGIDEGCGGPITDHTDFRIWIVRLNDIAYQGATLNGAKLEDLAYAADTAKVQLNAAFGGSGHHSYLSIPLECKRVIIENNSRYPVYYRVANSGIISNKHGVLKACEDNGGVVSNTGGKLDLSNYVGSIYLDYDSSDSADREVIITMIGVDNVLDYWKLT